MDIRTFISGGGGGASRSDGGVKRKEISSSQPPVKLMKPSIVNEEEMLQEFDDDEYRTATVSLERLPQALTRTISDIYWEIRGKEATDIKLNLKPKYQRNMNWDKGQRECLLTTIMDKCPMPLFLLYHDGDEFECIDGQNRLHTIQEFMDKEYTEEDDFEDAIGWTGYSGCSSLITPMLDDDVVDTRYFYPPRREEARAVMQSWMNRQNGLPRNCASPFAAVDVKKSKKRRRQFEFMTPDHVRRFHNYILYVSVVDTKLSVESRREIFMRWQKGAPTSECDKLKNILYPFCTFVTNHDVERRIVTKKLVRMLKKSSSEWLWDLFRLLRVFCSYPINNGIERFIMSRARTKKMITIEEKKFDPQWPEALEKCSLFIDHLISWKSCEGEMQISTILLLADRWNNDPSPFADQRLATRVASTLKSKDIMHCSLISVPTVTKFVSKYEITRANLFYTPLTTEPHKRQHIPHQRKTEVWNHHVGEEVGTSLCKCCKLVTISSRDFITGHIVPDCKGGSIDVSNLLPICAGCNSSMGTTNMHEYMTAMNY